MEKYAIVPFENLLVFPEDVEKDDYLHNPDPNDADRDCDVCTRRGAVNLVALTVVVVGVVTLFVVYPVLYECPSRIEVIQIRLTKQEEKKKVRKIN